jgi:hypothetical protein
MRTPQQGQGTPSLSSEASETGCGALLGLIGSPRWRIRHARVRQLAPQ